MGERHHVRRLRVVQLVQISLGVGQCQLKGLPHLWPGAGQHLPAVLDHPHVQVAKCQHVRLYIVELKRDQPATLGRILDLAHKLSAWAVTHTAVRHDHKVTAELEAGVVTGDIGTCTGGWRQLTRRKRRLEDTAHERTVMNSDSGSGSS